MKWLKEGLLNNYDDYSEILSTMVRDHPTKELAYTIRGVIYDMNILTREQVEQDIHEYATYTISDDLRRFLTICLRFIELTVKEPKKTVQNFMILGDEAKKLWHTNDDCIVALVLDKVIDYTNGLE